MNAFIAALRLDGAPTTRREVFGTLARLPKQAEWTSCVSGAFSATAQCGRVTMRPLLAQHCNVYGVGDVRLDNRSELALIARVNAQTASDLEIVLAAIDRQGVDIIPRILGDFSFVAWDANAQRLVAARDAFGVKPLFYRRTVEHLLISSRLDALSGDQQIDADYVAEFLLGIPSPGPRTIWRGALQVEPGAMLVQRGSVTAQKRYWSATTFEPGAAIAEADAVAQFKQLFSDAVQQRSVASGTWSQLSGGVDSSALVCTAEWLREQGLGNGLAGTITIADSLGTGDESRYCDAVLGRYGVANETIREYWAWRNDYGLVPAPTDEPAPLFPFFTREQHTVDVVSAGGGSVLLSGLGADHYMAGTLSYMADMFARGQLRAGAREVLQWSLQTRRSFWHTAKAHVVDPILKNARTHQARLGELFTTHTATELRRVAGWMLRGPFQDRLEVRYPFLSRPLVEFTLSLPISMRVRPEGRKWILREAMRGIMPEQVRTRQQKGGMDARVLWSLQQEKRLVDALVQDPILGQLGCVDVHEMRKAVELARQGAWQNTVQVFSVLALETWLCARLGAWPVAHVATQTAA